MKTLLSSILFFSCIYFVYGQENEVNTNINSDISDAPVKAKNPISTGYYINNRGDTVHCKFSIKPGLFDQIDVVNLQFEVTILDSLNKEVKLKPTDIKGYFTNYDGQEHFYKSIDNTWNYSKNMFIDSQSKIFLERVSDGYIKYYHYSYWQNSSTNANLAMNVIINKNIRHLITKDILKKEDGPFTEFMFNGFSMIGYTERLSEYFSDYPDLSKKIKHKEYKDMLKIVNKYDQWKSEGSIIIQDTTVYLTVDQAPTFKNCVKENFSECISYFFNSKIKLPENYTSDQKVIFN